MKSTFTCIALFVAHTIFGQLNHAANRPASNIGIVLNTHTEAEIDSLFQQAYPNGSPGAAVLIARNDTILYRKAFGMANLELNVPMQPENVFQLASMTKQFTSVGILILMEQGKLKLDDPLSTFIDDYPRGNEITLHHLLNHTSGIVSFNNLPDFFTKTRLDITPEEMINSFKDVPLEFNPGEQHVYSNSGYFLLGYIIEQRSGMSYESFVQKHIFEPLGMKNSYYANVYSIIPLRATGYQNYGGFPENAEYMSTSIPYAAGSLMSTVDDLLLWYKALHANTLISEKSKTLAFTNHTLNNGQRTNYGYGWYINEIAGIPTVEHPGGMNGFTTSGIYFPTENLFSVVLSNLDDGSGAQPYNIRVSGALFGESLAPKATVTLSEKQLKKWLGAYQFEDVVRFISYEDGALYSTREGGRPIKLEALSENEFRFENSLTTYQFSVKKGKKQVLFTDRIEKSLGRESDKKPIAAKEAIEVAPEILAKYTGTYELQPSFVIEIELRNTHLFALASGQPEVELFAEAENRFFIREIGAEIMFNLDANGTVLSLSFSQGGNQLEGRKTK